MNRVEQWFAILARKAPRIAGFAGIPALDCHLHRFIAHRDRHAHPFNWTTGSVTRVLAKCVAAEAASGAASFGYLLCGEVLRLQCNASPHLARG